VSRFDPKDIEESESESVEIPDLIAEMVIKMVKDKADDEQIFKLLDAKNKRMQHKERVQKLKSVSTSSKDKTTADLAACTRNFVQDLVSLCDPYVKNKYGVFKQMAVK